MEAKKAKPAVTPFDFGADTLNPHGRRGTEAVSGRSKRTLREAVVQGCPRVPGVYGMLDRDGDLIYVGKSKSLRSRLLSYFASSNAREKGGRIISKARVIQWETQPSEFASLLREQQLIRRFTPRWNVQGVPKRQRPVYLCLGRRPATFFVSAKPVKDMVAIEGPFYGQGRMKLAAEALNKVFKLRDCSSKQVFRFADQMDLFEMTYRPGCLRLETESCLGPCAAACSHGEYDRAVNAAESFMDGFNNEPLVTIRDAFERAVENLQFELAARHHSTLKSLEYLDRKLTLLNSARRQYTFVYEVAGYDGLLTWYLVHCGEIVDTMIAPTPVDLSNPDRMANVQETLSRWTSTTQNRLDRGHGAHPHTLAVVASWFRKHRSELKQRTFVPSDASSSLEKQGIASSLG